MQKERLLGGEPLLEIVAFQQPRDADMRGDFDQLAQVQRSIHSLLKRISVRAGVEHLEHLVFVGLGVEA